MPSIVVLETKELDILVLDDKEPDTIESETGPYVWCHDYPVGALLSWPWLSVLSGGSTEDEHAHLDHSDGIWEIF
jgi:hypothetical protein